MSFDAALVREQGVSFAVIAVKAGVLSAPSQRAQVSASFQLKFPGVSIVLMWQDGQGVPTYWGRPDIVRFLSRVAVGRLPWRHYH
jgi:hypothetical protein